MKIREVAAVYRKQSLTAPKQDAAYWRTLPFAERIAALEQIRNEYHTWKGDVQFGFQRVYCIVKRK
jgi:hypothetical protein